VRRLGLYGFGAAAHLIARSPRCRAAGSCVHATRRRRGPGVCAKRRCRVGRRLRRATRPSHLTQRSSSRRSAAWCPPRLRAVRKGGRVVCGGIHMSDIPALHTGCCGKNGRSCRWPTSHARTRASFSSMCRRIRCRCTSRPMRSRRPTRRWPTFGRGGCRVRRCSLP
jgi:hypothetical protein